MSVLVLVADEKAPLSYHHGMTEDTALRDCLARERTSLANERTLLAYMRTALGLVVTGASLIQFFESSAFVIAGWVLMPAGVALALVGSWRHLVVRRKISAGKPARTV
jgi:putative membrane protein